MNLEKMELPIYYCTNANFGDSLNDEIFKKFVSSRLAVTEVTAASVIGIGSLMESLLLEEGTTISASKEYIRVFSTGFGFGEGKHPRKRVIQPEKLKCEIECYAVRGKFSLERLKKMSTHSFENTVLADGGLLASELLPFEKGRKKYRLGIVPHMADKNHSLWKQLEDAIDGSIIIDVTMDPITVLKELSLCETVVSSGLHPLIACDSLGIPNAWIKVSDIPSDYKFKDYYSAFDKDVEPYVAGAFSINDDFVDEIQKNYNISYEQVTEKKEQLRQALARLKSDLERTGGFRKPVFSIKGLIDSIYSKYFTKKTKEILRFKDSDRILVVSPHPDDESIGCGALLQKYGKQCDVLLLTDGQKSRPKKEWTEEYVVSLRRQEFETAMDSVSVRSKIYAHWNDGRTLIEKPGLSLNFREYDYVFIPGRTEAHPDHRYANEAIRKFINKQKAQCQVLEYEVWATLSEPQYFLEIDIDKKATLIEYYQSQLMHINYVNRIKGLNFYRGMAFQVEYAECYQLLERNSFDRSLMKKIYAIYCKMVRVLR